MARGRVPGPTGAVGRGGESDPAGFVGPSGAVVSSMWSLGRGRSISVISNLGSVRHPAPLLLHSDFLGEQLDYDRIYRDIVRWEGAIPYMYLDTHKPPLVTVGAGNMLPDEGAAEALPFKNAATGQPATRTEKAHAFRAVAAMKGSLAAKHYRLHPSIELPEAKVKELAINRIKTEFIPQIKKLYPGFDGFPGPAREAILDIAYNAGVGQPERVAHGRKHKATGLFGFHRLKTAIDAGDWMGAARASHRSSSRPDRNEWARKLFEQAAHLAARRDGPSHSLDFLGAHLKLPVF